MKRSRSIEMGLLETARQATQRGTPHVAGSSTLGKVRMARGLRELLNNLEADLVIPPGIATREKLSNLPLINKL